MTMRNIARTLIAVGALLVAAHAQAEDWRGKAEGGAGGTKFGARCAWNEYLVGARVRMGDLIDAISPICIRYPGDQESYNMMPSGKSFGGTGGQPLAHMCPPNFPVVTAMRVTSSNSKGRANAYVDVVEMTCGREEKTQPLDTSFPTLVFHSRDERGGGIGVNPEQHGTSENTTCPDGMLAAGMFGAAGSVVDSLGLICTPMFPNNSASCARYATSAVAQVAEARTRQCGFTEMPRWNASKAAHRNWCRSIATPADLIAERTARAEALTNTCGLVEAPSGPVAGDLAVDPPARVEKPSDPSAYDKFEAPSGVIVGKPLPGTRAGTYVDPAAAGKYSDQMTKPPSGAITGGIAGTDFTGTWATVTAAYGRYVMKLTQTDAAVSGGYATSDGKVAGTISGTVVRASGTLTFRWTEGANTGSGKFKLSPDGASFKGWWNYSLDNPDVVEGSWNGVRQEEEFRQPR
jgi:hypothetical protein